MPRYATLLLILLASLPLIAQDAPRRGRAYQDVKARVERSGLLPGQKVPALTLRTLDNKEVELSETWKQRPALLVAASITCPIAKRTCPSITLKEHDFGNSVNTVILYTVEAHPRDGRSPYNPFKGKPSHFEFDQPDTIDERMKLAKMFAEGVKGVEVLVDPIDNRAWKAFGSGPNFAVLVGTDGKVIAKQGWFDPEKMRAEIEKLPKPPAAR